MTSIKIRIAYNKGKREDIVRNVAESITGRKFPSVRPNWLKNPKTKRNLELDCYCAELQFAFEVNGRQHYVFPNTFHISKADFDKQCERDKLKAHLCKVYGVKLVIVPYTVKREDLAAFVWNYIFDY